MKIKNTQTKRSQTNNIYSNKLMKRTCMRKEKQNKIKHIRQHNKKTSIQNNKRNNKHIF